MTTRDTQGDKKSGNKKVCAVVGVGPGNGAALAQRFAREGFAVALCARSKTTSEPLAKELPDARAYACDVSDPASVAKTFASIREEMGEVDTVIYNAGSGTWGTIDSVSAQDFESAWRVNTLGSFLIAKEVIPAMKAAKSGAFIFIGATASRRGMPMTVSFAPAKAAQKSLAESLARTLWPEGIHVAIVIVDGVIDLPRTRERMKDKPDEFFLKPTDIAEVAFQLTAQKRSAWSFEVEARPFGEKW